MWLWIIQIYRNYQQPFYPVTIHQQHAFWLLICIIQLLSSVTVCIIPGNICLTILYLYYQPSPSCYCCYHYLSGHFCLIFNFSTALLLALPLFSSQHKKPLTFVSLPVSMLQFSLNTQCPLLHFKLNIQYYRIRSHITFASTCRCRQNCNVLYLSRYLTIFTHTISNTKTKYFTTITAAQSVLSMQ